MKLTEHRRKLLIKLSRADIPAEAVTNAGNRRDLEWLQKNGLAEFTHLEDDDSIQFWAITDAGIKDLWK